MLVFRPFISPQIRCQKQLPQKSPLSTVTQMSVSFTTWIYLDVDNQAGRCLFACLTSSNASASHSSLRKPPVSEPVRGSISGSVGGRARNDSARSSGENVHGCFHKLDSSRLSSQLVLWRRPKRPVESSWSFVGCRCSLWGGFTEDSYWRFEELWMRVGLVWSNAWDKWRHEGGE